jgi:hypothetical protein
LKVSRTDRRKRSYPKKDKMMMAMRVMMMIKLEKLQNPKDKKIILKTSKIRM